ncbi:MAG: PHP-associated domain-containing protein [Eubacteriales bacterium]
MFTSEGKQNELHKNREETPDRYLFKYETHLHTSETSACAFDTGSDMVRAFAGAGYQGIVVTDHFFNGNTTVPSHLPWGRRVELFCRGYENARAEGDKCGLQVFFGWEYGYDHTDLLTYGLDREFLLEHPDILSWGLEEYAQQVHRHGGFITHAHPFREAFYISKIRLFPAIVDAVEVINASHTNPSYNRMALQYAKENNLRFMSGSDSHAVDQVFGGGVAFDRKMESIADLISTVRAGQDYQLLGK